MKRTAALVLTGTLLASSFGAVSCSEIGTLERYTLVGTGVGALSGLGIGALAGSHYLTGTLVGGGLGAVIGGLLGYYQEQN